MWYVWVCVTVCICVCGAVHSMVRVSLTTGLWIEELRGHPREDKHKIRGLSPLLLFVFILYYSSVQVEAVQPVQKKRAVCIQTAGCYGQSGNGGQGTDRGRGSRPVDSHHSHHGKLSSTERLVHSCVWSRSAQHTVARTRPCCCFFFIKALL